MPDIPNCHFEVIVDGCYEFLHDVTCSDKKPIKSLYRKTIITQFWNYIKKLVTLHIFCIIVLFILCFCYANPDTCIFQPLKY